MLAFAGLLEEQEFYADALSVLELVTESADATDQQKARSHFARGRLLLTEAGEAEQGLDEVRTALSLGFDDAEAAGRLLEHPDVTAVAEVRALLDETGLTGDVPSESAETGAQEPGPDLSEPEPPPPETDSQSQ